ncbi:YqzL family protein [Cohnella mopanensis]
MRDFTWHVFTQTGDIEAYLLYKEVHNLGTSELGADAGPEVEEGYAADEE